MFFFLLTRKSDQVNVFSRRFSPGSFCTNHGHHECQEDGHAGPAEPGRFVDPGKEWGGVQEHRDQAPNHTQLQKKEDEHVTEENASILAVGEQIYSNLQIPPITHQWVLC